MARTSMQISNPEPASATATAKASAAAMDALNLDDLFLGNDNEGDSLFADMDIDLGDMDGIIGDVVAVDDPGLINYGDQLVGSGNGTDSIMREVLSEEFGGFGAQVKDEGGMIGADWIMSGGNNISTGPADGFSQVKDRSETNEAGSDVEDEVTLIKRRKRRGMRPPPDDDDNDKSKNHPESSLSSAGKGGSGKNRKSKALANLSSSSLNTNKIKTRRSGARPIVVTSSSSPVEASNSGALEETLPPVHASHTLDHSPTHSPAQASTNITLPATAAHANAVLSSSLLQMPMQPLKTKRGVLPTRKTQQALLQKEKDPPSASSTCTYENSDVLLDILPTSRNMSSYDHAQPLTPAQIKAQEQVNSFGLKPSRTTFFPFMPLPVEVEVRRGQRAFPIMDKLNHVSAPVDDTGITKIPDSFDTGQESQVHEDCKDDSNEETRFTKEPLYLLFTQHLGALIDNHGISHSPSSLLKSLHRSTLLVSTFYSPNQKNNNLQTSNTLGAQNSRSKHDTHNEQQNNHHQHEMLIEELSKLFASLIRQKAFLRQNLYNMEEWAEDHFHEQDFKNAFQVRLKEIELREEANLQGVSGSRRVSSAVVEADTREKNGSSPLHKKHHSTVSNATSRTLPCSGTQCFPTSAVGTDSQAMPSPQIITHAPTHGGPNSTPVISVKVKIKCHGLKLNSSFLQRHTLEARLWSPVKWKTACHKANLALSDALDKPNATSSTSPSHSGMSALDASIVTNSGSNSVVATNPPESTAELVTITNSATPSLLSNKRKQRKGFFKTHETPITPAPTASTSTPSTPSSQTPAITPVAQPPNKQGSKERIPIHYQQSRIAHVLQNKILQPSITPTERRNVLATEIASAAQQMRNTYNSHQLSKYRQIEQEMSNIEMALEEDIETVPHHCNTIGMWRWVEHTNYFKELDQEDDVYDGLEGCWRPEIDRRACLEDSAGGLWGSYLPMPKVLVRDETGSGENGLYSNSPGENENEGGITPESSPLFDRLQSLLVEVDSSDNDKESNDDNDLLSDIPSFSSDQMIHGPDKIPSSDSSLDDTMLDISALTLDQRTYIQLRRARLIDTSTPCNHPPTLIEDYPPDTSIDSDHPPGNDAISDDAISDNESSLNEPNATSNNIDEDDSINTVLQKMKSHLSTLHHKTNTQVASLQRKALSQVYQSRQKRKRLEKEDIIGRYMHWKMSKEKKRGKAKVVTSGGEKVAEHW